MLLYAGGGIENEQVRQYIVQQGGEEIESGFGPTNM